MVVRDGGEGCWYRTMARRGWWYGMEVRDGGTGWWYRMVV